MSLSFGGYRGQMGVAGGATAKAAPANLLHFSDADAYEDYWRHRSQGKITVVDYSATWCGPCKEFEPVYAELATVYPHIDFLHVVYDKLTDGISERDLQADLRNVSGFPTFKFFIDGLQTQIYDYEAGDFAYQIVGVRPDNPQNIIRALHSTSIAKVEIDRHVKRQ